MIDTTLPASIALGLILGAISGLIPGLHLNNFASLLLAASPQLMALGLMPFQISCMILAASISQTFFDSIPAVFLGAPDSETALTVLPGNRLMLEGRGVEAVRLSALGSAGSILISLLLMAPVSWTVYSCYDHLTRYIGIALLAIALSMVRSETGPIIEGQGSWVRYKYQAVAGLLFLTSGLLGIFAFGHSGLVSSPAGLEPEILLPMLSGLFGAPSMLLSLQSGGSAAPQQRESEIAISATSLLRSVLSGSLGGSIVAWIPGISPTVAVMAMRPGDAPRPEEFLVSVAGVNTANAIFSLVALYVIDRPRSGAAAAIQELMELDWQSFTMMIIVVVIAAIVSYPACIASARLAGVAVSRLNRRLLSISVLLFLFAMCYAFTGFFGLFIFFLSTIVGSIAPVAGIRRSHAMGALMLPLIVRYI